MHYERLEGGQGCHVIDRHCDKQSSAYHAHTVSIRIEVSAKCYSHTYNDVVYSFAGSNARVL